MVGTRNDDVNADFMPGEVGDVAMPAAHWSLKPERHPGQVASPDVEPVDVGVVGFFRLHTCARFAGLPAQRMDLRNGR
jgi:hypothetical protein